MAQFRPVIMVIVLMAFIFVATGNKHRRLHARQHGHHGPPMLCTNDQNLNPYLPPCPTTSTIVSTTTESTTAMTTTTTTMTTTEKTSTTTPTSLQRAHWCRQANNTYLPLGYTFTQGACSICQCTAFRTIVCQPFQCMPTYCVDNSMPLRKSGQCCTQCLYDSVLNSTCSYNGLTYPHGSIMRVVNNKMQCWCQLGNIECRDYAGASFENTDLFNDNTVVYVVVIVIIIVLLLGAITCCACTVFTYYYYQRYASAIQQTYDEYVNSAGWQPMDENEQNPADLSAEEKRIEAEKTNFSNLTGEMVPPPYVVYQESYAAGTEGKQS